MKTIYILILLSLAGCAPKSSLKIETVLAKSDRNAVKDTATGKITYRNTYVPITPELEPKIKMISKNGNKLTLQLQGNISSGGLRISKVKTLRMEQDQKYGNSITLKYIVEIITIPGKEGSNVQGYNYIKNVQYDIPNDVKVIKVELYEERLKNAADNTKTTKLLTTNTFDFYPKI